MTHPKTSQQIADDIVTAYQLARTGIDGDAWLANAIAEALAGRDHLLPSQSEPSQAEPSQAEPSQAEPSQAEPSQAEPRREPIDLVLCTGMPRSGSTWSYNVCMSLLQSAYPNAAVAGLYSENTHAVLEQRKAEYLVIKCHAVDEFGRGAIERGDCRTIYTYRDPREAVASTMVFAKIPFEVALGSIKASLDFMTFQRRFGDSLFIAYAELIENPTSTIRKIARHLGLGDDDTVIAEAHRRCGRDAIAAVADRVTTLPPDEVYQDDKYMYDRRTLIHRNHLTGAGARWQEMLTPAQVTQIQQTTWPWAELWPDTGSWYGAVAVS